MAQDLHNIQFNGNNRMISLDIKDLYINLPTKNILHTTAQLSKKTTMTR
jgi:hypothetical protein